MNSYRTGYLIGRELHDRVLEGASRSEDTLFQILLSTVICLCCLKEMASTSAKNTKGSSARFVEILWAMVNDENEIKKCGKHISWNEVFLI